MNDDLIKRSDAIKALRKLGHEVVVIDKVCSLGVAVEFIDAIRAIPSADRPQEWIPCSEKLPDRYKRVLTTSKKGMVRENFINAGGWSYDTYSVVAWMSLPKPYEERSK